jgi:hypothetical protein
VICFDDGGVDGEGCTIGECGEGIELSDGVRREVYGIEYGGITTVVVGYGECNGVVYDGGVVVGQGIVRNGVGGGMYVYS